MKEKDFLAQFPLPFFFKTLLLVSFSLSSFPFEGGGMNSAQWDGGCPASLQWKIRHKKCEKKWVKTRWTESIWKDGYWERVREIEIVCLCEREGESERDTVCACVWEREGERKQMKVEGCLFSVDLFTPTSRQTSIIVIEQKKSKREKENPVCWERSTIETQSLKLQRKQWLCWRKKGQRRWMRRFF